MQQEAQALNQSMNLGLQLQLRPRLKAGRSVGIYQRGRMNSYFYVSLSTTIKIGYNQFWTMTIWELQFLCQ